MGSFCTHGAPGTPVCVELLGGDQVVLTVSNAGVPIPRETLATLFDPFRRGERSSVAAPGGLGLGLYIADQIVRAHGKHDAFGCVVGVRIENLRVFVNEVRRRQRRSSPRRRARPA